MATDCRSDLPSTSSTCNDPTVAGTEMSKVDKYLKGNGQSELESLISNSEMFVVKTPQKRNFKQTPMRRIDVSDLFCYNPDDFYQLNDNGQTAPGSETNITASAAEIRNDRECRIEQSCSPVIEECEEYKSPRNFTEFIDTWKVLKGEEQQYKYLKVINVDNLRNIFKELLDSQTFSEILHILHNKFMAKNEIVHKFMQALTITKRFSTLTMFMSGEDRIVKIVEQLSVNLLETTEYKVLVNLLLKSLKKLLTNNF